MKKFLIAIVVLVFLFSSAACNAKVNLSEYVSQVRVACYLGSNPDVEVTAYPEMREYPLKADGFVGETAAYVILKIVFLTEQNMLINDLSADFYINRQYSCRLPYKAEADSYVAVVKVDELPKEGLTVTVSYGGKTENVTLNKVGGDAISPFEALNIAAEYKKSLIDALIGEDKDFEITIRIMAESDKLYYYVGIVETEYTTALLISAEGKVLTEKRLKNQ